MPIGNSATVERKVVAIVPAAGRGERFGASVPKQFLPLQGIPIIVHTLRCMQAVEDIHAVIVAVPAGFEELVHTLCREHGLSKVHRIIPGGKERQESVALALQSPEVATAELLVVHDGVRPFASPALFRAVVAAARQYGAAVPGIPPPDTVKWVSSDGMVQQTLPREHLRLIQTPQAFRRELLQRAYEAACRRGLRATDDAGLVEALGHPIAVVPGIPENIKITHAADLAFAEALLHQRSCP
jgi:2-C-methyl-D-erythritol 4-phosphate cytidylyltransferase